MKKIIALILALTLALTLAACNKSGDNPTGDNSTPGTSSTPGTTIKPSDTWADYYVADPSVKVFDEPEKKNEERNTLLDSDLAATDIHLGIDTKKIIDETYKKYGKYLNVNITKSAMYVGIVTGVNSSFFQSKGNITGISDTALNKVNDFLKEKGEQQLDVKNPEHSITAMWLAVSFYFDPEYVGDGLPGRTMAMPFGLARSNQNNAEAEHNAEAYWSIYASLFNLMDGHLYY